MIGQAGKHSILADDDVAVHVAPHGHTLLAGRYAAKLRRLTNAGGHYKGCDAGRYAMGIEADGTINGQAVTFLVDTGATDVALPESIARSLGLEADWFEPHVDQGNSILRYGFYLL